MTNDLRKDKTKQKLERVLAGLLQQQSFDDITTTQLAQAAQISRSGFYTHYKDKYELIDNYQQKLFNQLEYLFDKHSLDTQGAALEIFEFLHREPLFAALLSRNGSRDIQDYIKNKFKLLIIKELEQGSSRSVKQTFEEKKLAPNEMDYAIIYLVNALFGVCQMWIEGGKTESPQQMTRIIFKMMRSDSKI